MIISSSQIQNIIKIFNETKQVKNSKPQGNSPAGKNDEVILSTHAQEFSQVYQTIKALPDRMDKVKDISDRIAQNNYSVDAKDVAEKMLGRIMADSLKY